MESVTEDAFGHSITDEMEKLFATQISPDQLPAGAGSNNLKSFIVNRYLAAYDRVLLQHMKASSIQKFRLLQHYTCALIVGSTAFGTITKPAPASAFQVCALPQYFGLLIKFFETEGFAVQNPFSRIPSSGSMPLSSARSLEDTPALSVGAKPTVSTTCNEKYVKDVYRMSRTDGRMVEIIVAMTHPLEMAFDFTKPDERNVKIASTYFNGGYLVVNPYFTIYDYLSYSSDTGPFPRQVGDSITGVIPLKPFTVPTFMTLGHRAMLRPHSWQMVLSEQNFPSIRMEFLKATRFLQTYLVAPVLYTEYKTRLPKELNVPLTHVNTSCFAVHPFSDERHLPFFMQVYKDLYGPASNLRTLVDDLLRGLRSSRKDASFTTAEEFPPAAISFLVVNALSKLKGIRDGTMKVQASIVKRPTSMDVTSVLGVQFIVNLSSSSLSSAEESLILPETIKLRELGSEILLHPCDIINHFMFDVGAACLRSSESGSVGIAISHDDDWLFALPTISSTAEFPESKTLIQRLLTRCKIVLEKGVVYSDIIIDSEWPAKRHGEGDRIGTEVFLEIIEDGAQADPSFSSFPNFVYQIESQKNLMQDTYHLSAPKDASGHSYSSMEDEQWHPESFWLPTTTATTTPGYRAPMDNQSSHDYYDDQNPTYSHGTISLQSGYSHGGTSGRGSTSPVPDPHHHSSTLMAPHTHHHPCIEGEKRYPQSSGFPAVTALGYSATRQYSQANQSGAPPLNTVAHSAYSGQQDPFSGVYTTLDRKGTSPRHAPRHLASTNSYKQPVEGDEAFARQLAAEQAEFQDKYERLIKDDEAFARQLIAEEEKALIKQRRAMGARKCSNLPPAYDQAPSAKPSLSVALEPIVPGNDRTGSVSTTSVPTDSPYLMPLTPVRPQPLKHANPDFLGLPVRSRSSRKSLLGKSRWTSLSSSSSKLGLSKSKSEPSKASPTEPDTRDPLVVGSPPIRINATQFVDISLLRGVSMSFSPTAIFPIDEPMNSPPQLITLGYGASPPLHIQGPNWQQLLQLMTGLSATRIEPTTQSFEQASAEMQLRTVVQFFQPDLSSPEWRTILWFTIDYPVPDQPQFHRYDVEVLPFSYSLTACPALLRNKSDTPHSKRYTIPSTESLPYPTLPITFPNLALYLQAALDESRRYMDDNSSELRKLAKMINTCYPSLYYDHDKKAGTEGSRSIGKMFNKFIGRGNKANKRGRRNEDTYRLVTPFIPEED
ncbi:hypothetical protein VNI00_018088 [Paramarasmius palmivorus]|uniref:Uncharacterized protein n=1 Tax=Paramarasmius palmivorus TaxID=297713 RepID=A0AAW0B2G1_9AGAR